VARIAVTEAEAAGATAVVVLADGQAVGMPGLVDRLRPDAAHEGSTVVVGLNGLWLLPSRHWRP
jgi:cation transport ATPase